MNRREVLGMLGLGGLPSRRPDQQYNPGGAAVAPGTSAGVFRGRLVVISGTSANGSNGLFVYSGTPALGNLIASIAAAAGVDPYGNAYPRGYMDQTGGAQALIDAGGFTAIDGVGNNAQLNNFGLSFLSNTDNSSLNPVGNPAAPFAGGMWVSGYGLSGEDPNTPGQNDPWHTMSSLVYKNGWGDVAGSEHGQYRKSALGGCIELKGNLSAGTTALGTVVVNLPPGYRPATTPQTVDLSARGAPPALSAPPSFDILANGNVTTRNCAGMTVCGFDGVAIVSLE